MGSKRHIVHSTDVFTYKPYQSHYWCPSGIQSMLLRHESKPTFGVQNSNFQRISWQCWWVQHSEFTCDLRKRLNGKQFEGPREKRNGLKVHYDILPSQISLTSHGNAYKLAFFNYFNQNKPTIRIMGFNFKNNLAFSEQDIIAHTMMRQALPIVVQWNNLTSLSLALFDSRHCTIGKNGARACVRIATKIMQSMIMKCMHVYYSRTSFPIFQKQKKMLHVC